MKINIGSRDGKAVSIDGAEARQAIRRVMQNNTDCMLLPIPEAARRLRKRMGETLRAGRPIWDHLTPEGNPSSKSTILTMPPKIVGLIKEDGTFEAAEGLSAEEKAEVEKMMEKEKDNAVRD